MRKIGILVVLALLFAGYVLSIARMESLKTSGRDVLLLLAPVDPRALLMGDYMTLDYSVNQEIRRALRAAYSPPDSGSPRSMFASGRKIARSFPAEGVAVVRLKPLPEKDNGGNGAVPEAVFARLDDGTPLAGDEAFLAFKVRGAGIVSAASAYYFQEGHARAYEGARFGRLKMGENGKTLLVALCGADGRDLRFAEEGREGK